MYEGIRCGNAVRQCRYHIADCESVVRMNFRVSCETAVQIGQPEAESSETVLKKRKDT